jgi:membrane protein implicated in regulation of membrane protease activity
METVFFAAFLFGVLFTIASFLLGFAGTGIHVGDGGIHLGDGGVHVGDFTTDGVHHNGGDHGGLPLLNLSSLLAFLTWFGAIGFILMRFAGWPVFTALPVAVIAGATGAVLISLLLGRLLAGSRALDPRDYKIEGTIARVTSGILQGGMGEITFSQAGATRSESARSRTGGPISRDTEVVVIDYANGVAIVEPWDEFVGRERTDSPEHDS